MGPSPANGLLHRHRAKRQPWPEAFGVDGLRVAGSRARGTQGHCFFSLVELSTRIREARMVISQVTARTEPAVLPTSTTYKDYLAGVRTLSELEEPG